MFLFQSELDSRSADKPKKTESDETNERPTSKQYSVKAASPVEIIAQSPSHEPSQVQKSPLDNVEGASSPTKAIIELDEKLMEDVTPETRRKIFREAFNQRINHNPSSGEPDRRDQAANTTPGEPNAVKPAPQLQSMFSFKVYMK